MKLILTLVFFLTAVSSPQAKDINKAAEKSFSFKQLLKSISEPGIKDIKFSLPEPSKANENFVLRGDDRYWITVMASDKHERTKLLEAGLDILEVEKNKVSGIAHKGTLDTLAEKGYIIESKMTLATFAKDFEKDFPANDEAYHNYDEMIEVLKTVSQQNEDITSLYSIGKSLEGREIWTLRINTSAKGTESSDKPGAVFMGAHHAREHLSVEVPLLHAVWLLENREKPEIKKYIDSLDIYIMPMINPDGAEYDISGSRYKWHRKNMRKNPDGNIGVDLNRNYAFRWGGAGASHSTYSDTYCGPSAFSEPESQAVKKFVESNDNLETLLSYHSYSELILYPWGGIYEPVENEDDRKVFIAMAKKMAGLTGYTAKQSSDLYAATGDTTDWTYATKGIFSFTVELTPSRYSGGGFYPGPSVIEKTVRTNIDAANYLLSVTANPYSVIK